MIYIQGYPSNVKMLLSCFAGYGKCIQRLLLLYQEPAPTGTATMCVWNKNSQFMAIAETKGIKTLFYLHRTSEGAKPILRYAGLIYSCRPQSILPLSRGRNNKKGDKDGIESDVAYRMWVSGQPKQNQNDNRMGVGQV